jgi:MarR family transcriptional regulator, lower aerobic nicotinate degradation pathway regulator
MPTSKKTTKSADILDDQIGFVLRLAVQFHTAIFTARMVEGLTQTQFATLSKVYEVGSCTQSDLGRLLTLDSATVNGVTDRMYSRGLIEISADLVDRRRQSISLSKEGLRIIVEAEAVAQEITEETMAALTPVEQARIVQLLRKMIGAQAALSKQDILLTARAKSRKTAPGTKRPVARS